MVKFQYLFDYTPYFCGGSNDQMSRTLLSFKRNHDSAFRFMRSMMVNYFDLGEFDKSKTVVCCVPGHEANLYSPIQRLTSEIATECGFLDGTHLIRKLYATESFCRSGIRDSKALRESIEVDQIIGGLRVILLDDVATTGTSFSVVSRLLMEAGAGSVECVALGQTVKLNSRRLSHA
jgi:predicted amidophosphoribosyltransferase